MPISAGARFAKFTATTTLLLLAACQPLPQKADSDPLSATGQAQAEASKQQTLQCPPAPKPKTQVVRVPVDVRGKRVFGAVEELHLQLPSSTLKLNARIDTGATSSSLHAREIIPFERDGKSWVRFTSGEGNNAQRIELPVVRTIRIKNKGGESVARPVVQIKVNIGPVTQRLEMNLADRSNFDFPALIGRDFLKDVAIVDVSQKHIAVAPAPRIK